MRRFLDLASAEDAVSQAYAVTGESDVVLMLRLKDMKSLPSSATGCFATRRM